MVKKRLPLKNGDEYDVVNQAWRRIYCWTQWPGNCKKVKNRINRRERRDGKSEAYGEW